MKKILNILEWLTLLIISVFILRVLIWAIKEIKYYVIDYKPPICHYEYIDTFGSNGVSPTCSSYYGHIYCKDKDRVILVSSIREVCRGGS